jgi:predicted nucleic acid-binding Zn ribbon protein
VLRKYFSRNEKFLGNIERSQAVLAWPRVVGESVAAVASAVRVRDGKLFVRVCDPLWACELSFQKSMILARYAKEFPALGLRDIFFSPNP